jgi:ATP-binding cassette subfamily C protein
MGVTTVVITQRPALLSIVDKVLILRAGRAEAFGPPQVVLRRLFQGVDSQKATAEEALRATGGASRNPTDKNAAKAEPAR